jgi:hypothetical protein
VTLRGLAPIIGFVCAALVLGGMGKVPRPNPFYQGYLVNDGDSLPTIDGSTDGGSLMTYVAVPGKALAAPTVAVIGQTLAGNITSFPNTVGAVYNSAKAVYGVSIPFVVQIYAGGNDIRGGASAATIFANLQSYVNLVHALGPNAKVIVVGYLVQCDIQQNGSWVAVLQTLNTNVIANWNVIQGSGGLGADGLANYFANPTIGPNTYASSAFCGFPNTYSPDGQHMTDVAKAIAGPIEVAAATPLFP